MELVEKLFQALKKDNVKEFESCMEISNCGSLRLGRFPVLSVMYLYNARRLLRAYEKRFLKHNSWQDIGEPMELSAKFRSVAGKCLRLYMNETVSPVEMLLLLDKNFKLQRIFPKARTTAPVKQRIKDIYFIRWGLQAEFSHNKIVLQRRPLTRAEKVQWLIRALCMTLVAAIIVATPFVVDTFSRFIPNGEGVVTVTKWEQIRFRSNKTYVLQNDVTVSEKSFAKVVNCKLRGNGNAVTVTGNRLFGDVKGEIADIVFVTNGSTLAQNVTLGAKVNNVTVNANVDITTDSDCAFFANNNFGKISNVQLNVTGTLAVAPKAEQADNEEIVTPYCGGIVAINNFTVTGNKIQYATVQDCIANYNNFALHGQVQANASFGGIVGQNNARVQNCQVKGDIAADTFDVGGICAENNYLLLQDKNYANITQQTEFAEWNPIVGGVVAINDFDGEVNNCVNFGVISGISQAAVVLDEDQAPFVYVSGVAGRANGNILDSANMGAISAKSNNGTSAGGIAGASCAQTYQCLSVGSVTATGKTCYVGGIWGESMFLVRDSVLYYGLVIRCIAQCEVKATTASATGFVAVGGIVGYVPEIKVNLIGQDEPVYVSGILGYCYFTGKLSLSEGAYVGAIAGVIGQTVYQLTVDDSRNKSFYSNIYADNVGAGFAFGAAVSGKNYQTVDDVGAQVATEEQIVGNASYNAILHIFDEYTQQGI